MHECCLFLLFEPSQLLKLPRWYQCKSVTYLFCSIHLRCWTYQDDTNASVLPIYSVRSTSVAEVTEMIPMQECYLFILFDPPLLLKLPRWYQCKSVTYLFCSIHLSCWSYQDDTNARVLPIYSVRTTSVAEVTKMIPMQVCYLFILFDPPPLLNLPRWYQCKSVPFYSVRSTSVAEVTKMIPMQECYLFILFDPPLLLKIPRWYHAIISNV